MRTRIPRDISDVHKTRGNKKDRITKQNRYHEPIEIVVTVPYVDISSISKKIAPGLVDSEIFYDQEYFFSKPLKITYHQESLKEFYLDPESLNHYYKNHLKPALKNLKQDTKLSIGMARELIIRLITENLDNKGSEYFKEFCMDRINENFPKDRKDEIINLEFITETGILDQIIEGITNDEKERRGYTQEEYNKLILIRGGWSEYYHTKIAQHIYDNVRLKGLEDPVAHVIAAAGDKIKTSVLHYNNIFTKKSNYNEEDYEKYGYKTYIRKEEAFKKSKYSAYFIIALTAFAMYELYEQYNKFEIKKEMQDIESIDEKVEHYNFVALFIAQQSKNKQDKIVEIEKKIDNYKLAMDLLDTYKRDRSFNAWYYGISGMKNISEWSDDVIKIATKELDHNQGDIARATRMLHSKISNLKIKKGNLEKDWGELLELAHLMESNMNKLDDKKEEKEYNQESEKASKFNPRI